MLLKQLGFLKKRVRLQQIIVIQQPDPFAMRLFDGVVCRSRNSPIVIESEDSDAAITLGKPRQAFLQGRVRRSIVNQDELPIIVGLSKH